jgi:predicted helicase
LTKSGSEPSPQVSRTDLWGSCDAKLQQLSTAADGTALPSQQIIPAAPWFTFAEQPAEILPEYKAAPLLTELMPVNSTVPVTARDHFVIAATREELQERLAEFCDPKIPDEEIRHKYFQRTRSNRYEPGDTRGWKLPAARRTLMNEADPAKCIRRCLYRPFVWRYVLWHPALIDWPRTEFTRHFDHGNLALLARRQSIAGREANFFWISDCLPLDGVIRSDNRGSESFFPLRLNSAEHEERPLLNFASELCGGCEPAKMLSYLYGLFHSPTYRTRYAAALGMEFPRALLPQSNSLFESIAELGGRLIKIHRTDPLQTKITPDPDVRLTTAIENFHVGTYNVCRKWLQMQKQDRESPAFAGLQQLICYTLQLQEQIEETIASAGGFPQAFRELESRL